MFQDRGTYREQEIRTEPVKRCGSDTSQRREVGVIDPLDKNVTDRCCHQDFQQEQGLRQRCVQDTTIPKEVESIVKLAGDKVSGATTA